MKKTIKILLALTLSSSMLMSFCPISQAAQDPNLTYELDFSDLNQTTTDAGNRGLKSSCTRTDVTINQHYFPANANPLTVQEIEGVDAIVLGSNNGFLIDSTSTIPAFGSKNVTIEMWVYKKSNSASSGNMFAFKRNKTSTDELQMYFTGADAMSFMPYYATSGVAGNAGNTRVAYTFSQKHYTDHWEHITITRTYDDAGTSATTKLYSNGVLIGEYSKSDLPEFATPQRIYFGAYASSANPDVAVAAFRVYDKVLSQAEIQGKFDAEKDTYSDAPKFSSLAAPDYKTANITLAFEENMPSAIGSSNIVIQEKVSGDEIKTTVSSVDADNKTVTVSLGQMLKPSNEYVIKYVSNPDSTAPNPFDPEMNFTTQDYVEKATITPTKETNNLKVVTAFNDASIGKKCCVLAVVYDDTGRMVKPVGTMQSFVVAGDNQSCTLNINSTGFTTDYKVKVYAWNMSGIVPMQMSEPVVIDY